MYTLFNLFVIHRDDWRLVASNVISSMLQYGLVNTSHLSGEQLSHNTLTGWQTNIHGFLFVSTEGNLRAAPLLPPLREILSLLLIFLHKESPGLLWSGDWVERSVLYPSGSLLSPLSLCSIENWLPVTHNGIALEHEGGGWLFIQSF